MKIEIIPASELNIGDTVSIEGDWFTLGADCIKTGFCGTLVRGERFSNGIERVLFPKWYKGEIIDYRPQI